MNFQAILVRARSTEPGMNPEMSKTGVFGQDQLPRNQSGVRGGYIVAQSVSHQIMRDEHGSQVRRPASTPPPSSRPWMAEHQTSAVWST